MLFSSNYDHDRLIIVLKLKFHIQYPPIQKKFSLHMAKLNMNMNEICIWAGP